MKTVLPDGAKTPTSKKPLQKRALDTQRRIVDAAKELFSEQGFEETTTTLIAKRAGVSIGGLYGRFNNKWEMFLIILQEHSEATFHFLKGWIDRIMVREQDLPEAFNVFIPALYKAHKLEGRLNYEIRRLIMINEEARSIHRHWEHKEEEELHRFLSQYKPGASSDDIKTIASILHRSTHEVFNYMYENSHELDEENYMEHFIKMISSYLDAV